MMLIYVIFVIDSLKVFGILINYCIIGFLYVKYVWYGMVILFVKYFVLGIFYVNGIGIFFFINFFLYMIMNKCVEFVWFFFYNVFFVES